jgi:hypothetical protein
MAATGYGAAIDEIVCADRFLRRAALALAKPVRAPAMVGGSPNYDQITESLAGQIVEVLTTASLRIAVEKIRPADCNFVPALATAEPISLSISYFSEPQHGEFMKGSSG